MVDASVVELVGAGKVYGGPVLTRALTGANLSVGPSEFVAVLGPSGSGKSTLLHLLGALDRPSEGTVKVMGQDLAKLDDDGLAKLRGEHLGFVFQFHHLLPDFTALENVLLPSFARGGEPTAERRQAAIDLLHRVGLEGKENNRATDLSGGQQQRVAIARALYGKKSLVLADEPTGNLDTNNGKEVFRLMRQFCAQDGVTFMVVTHDLQLALYADRIVHVVDGRISQDHPNDPVPL